MNKYLTGLFLVLILALVPLTASLADSISLFEQRIKRWEETIKSIKTDIEKNNIPKEKIASTKQRLRDIKSSATEENSLAEEMLSQQKALLSALGPPPAEGEAAEQASVKKQRKELNDFISLIDARAKRSSLVVSSAQDLLNKFTEIRKTEKREKLFIRNGSPILSLSKAANESSKWFREFVHWLNSLFILIAIGVSSTGLFIACKHINAYLQTQSMMLLKKPLSRKKLISTTIAAIFLFTFQRNLLGTAEFSNFHANIITACTLWLAFLLYGIYSLFYFNPFSTYVEESEHHEKAHYAWFWNLLLVLIKILIVSILVFSIVGYTELTAFVALNLFILLIIVSIFTIVRNIIDWLANEIRTSNDDHGLPPTVIIFVEPAIALGCILLIFSFWGISFSEMADWFDKYRTGIPIGSVTINPIDLGAALVIFFVIYFITRIVQWFLSERVFKQTAINVGIQNAIHTMVGYTGIFIAVLVSLGTLGISMASIAIVAGALSVGIGFGLQSIFNNFVSGLILLFERPIKVGDWVVVGDKEGFVKKIRVRSTELETFQMASIIVPNSQLISEVVTNWTLDNPTGRVDIIVGVAYGSDVKLVAKTLLEVADSHPEVRKRPEPKVLLKRFGDSSLDFELRCYLKQIQTLPITSSDIRYQIVEAFEKNNITIPFPQRDIHIIGKEPSTKPTKGIKRGKKGTK